MVLKGKFCIILKKILQIYDSIIFEFSLSYIKFPLSKLYDLIRRKIQKDFNAKDEDRLTPFEDDKLKSIEFNKYKAKTVRLFDDVSNLNGRGSTIVLMRKVRASQDRMPEKSRWRRL